MLSLNRLEPDSPVTGFGLEAIDFQPPGFFKLLSNLFQRIIDESQASADGLITDKMIRDSNLVKLTRANTGLFVSKIDVVDTNERPEMSFNMYCTMVDFGSGHILNHDVYENWHAYTGSNLSKDALGKLYKESKGVLKGGMDLKNAKVTGDFTRVPFEVGISDDFVKRFKETAAGTKYQVKGEHLAFVYLHELGHAWDMFEYLVYDVRTNIVINTAIALCVSESDESKRRQILVDLENEVNTPIPDKNELAQKNDGAFYYVSIQGRAKQERLSIYQAHGYDGINNENGADIFATRFGGGRAGIEVVAMFGRDYAAWRQKLGGMRLKSLGVGTATGALLAVAYTLELGVSILSSAVVGGVFGASLCIIGMIATSPYNQNYIGGMYDDYYGRVQRTLREMYAQLKDTSLNAAQRRLLQSDINEAEKAVTLVGKDNPLVKTFVQLFNANARKELSIKQLHTNLESLVNNKLYSQANKFDLLSED